MAKAALVPSFGADAPSTTGRDYHRHPELYLGSTPGTDSVPTSAERASGCE